MFCKIKKIFVFSIFFLGLSILVAFAISIYFKHFHNSSEPKIANSQQIATITNKIVIYNATNVSGLAKDLKLFLRSFEVKEVQTENYDTLLDRCRFLTKPNYFSTAEYIAKLIEFQPEMITITDTIDNDIVIILGTDYKLLKPFKN